MSGRITYQKAYDRLLEAMAILDAGGLHDRYEIIVIGNLTGWDRNETSERALLQADNVYLMGFMDNPFPVVKTADWFLSTSRYEGQSLSLQEAAVLGVPIIATDCAGVRELLGDSKYGIVTEHTAESIADNMRRVIEDSALRDHYRDQIVERSAIITWDERWQAILELL